MNIYFFTAVDKDPVYRAEADILIRSGKQYGRIIHLHDIPDDQYWGRYKAWIIGSDDLPAADRYVYLDSDSIMTGPGDWESKKCQGVMDSLYFMKPGDRNKKLMSFIRCMTSCNHDGRGLIYLRRLWFGFGFPSWYNSGVVVLDAEKRIPFCKLWIEYIELLDTLSENEYLPGDEPALMFARQEFNLPILSPKYNWLLKYQPDPGGARLIHADGNVAGVKREPYVRAVENLKKLELGNG